VANLDLIEPLRSVNPASRGDASLARRQSSCKSEVFFVCVTRDTGAATQVAEMQHLGREQPRPGCFRLAGRAVFGRRAVV